MNGEKRIADEQEFCLANNKLIQWGAVCLIAGGVLTALLNAILTPALPHGVPFAVMAASQVFLWRQSASALAAILLLFGCLGLYLLQADRAGRFGAISFILAVSGTALLLGVEWNEIFDVRDFAQRAPETLNLLNSAKAMTLSTVGSLIALGVFMLGWIGLAVSTLRSKAASRAAAWLVIAGFFATPLLTPLLHRVWAGVVGNLILGSGLVWLGFGILARRGLDRRA